MLHVAEWYADLCPAMLPAKIPLMSDYTAIVKQSGDDWIGWIEEVPGVNCQEETREELIATLRITLAEALELNRADARSAATENFEEIRIAV